MWECPEYQQEFKTQNEEHTCCDSPSVIDEYIALQPEGVQSILNRVRDVIRGVLPDAEERISWKMPTFYKTHNIIHFASYKNHLGLYPGVEAIKHFSDHLQGFRTSKGAIQFQYSQPIPYNLIAEIALWCYETGNHH